MSRWTGIWIMALAAAILSVATPVMAESFAFLPKVVVTAEQVSLADLVSPRENVPSQWHQVIVCAAPRPGSTSTVTAAQIKLGLRDVGVDPNTLGVDIPLRVELQRAGQVLMAETVRGQFETALREQLDFPTTSFQIELVGWPAVLVIPTGTIKIAITEDTSVLNKSLFRDYASFAYEVQVDEKVEQSGRARVRITAAAQVPVLVRDLQRNTVISREDLELREVSLTKVKADTHTTIEEILGYRTTRLLRKGLPINRGDIEVPPLVLYNSRVRLIASYNGVVVETVGRALMDGGMGDIIRVENTATGRIVSATVVSAGCAEALL